MKAFEPLISQTVVLAQENIDTDQIIPARFLTTTSFEGLGQHAFADWRYDPSGIAIRSCVLNEPLTAQCQVLVAGRNFGCGSSREHAPRALIDFGFRVVISNEIADIFKNNAYNCGLLPIVLPKAEHQWLLEHPATEVCISLQHQYVELAEGHRVSFEIDAFAKHCLLLGKDRMDLLLEQIPAIQKFEEDAA